MPFKDPSSPAAKASQARRHRNYRVAHPMREKTARQRVYAVNPEHGRQVTARWRATHPDLSRYVTLKSAAKSRGVDCSISFSEYVTLIANQPCYYCGGVLPQSGYGVDRINAGIGYVTGNVRPCCGDCNTAKSDMTEIEFKIWALRLANHWATKEN
jgi:hypothetical protein